MYLINNPLKNIKTITLLLICFLTFNVFANEADELLSITKSAEQGDAPAQYNMGVSYFFGNGVSQDYKQAIDWFLKATEQNNAEAEAFLGEMYDTGQGVVKNDKKAAKWYSPDSVDHYTISW